MSTGNLPEGWREVRFGEVTTFTRKPRGLDYSEFGYIPFVPMGLVPIGATYMNDHELREGGEITSGTYFEDGDVLLARITPSFENGKQVIVESLPEPFGVGTTEVIPFKAKSGVSQREYLFYFLLRSGVRNDLAGKMEGSTGRQRLKPRTLKSLRVPLPPVDEQRAIADALKSVEDAMQARRQELEIERERKAALLDLLVVKGTRGETLRSTPVGEQPQGWGLQKLGEIAEVAYGLTVNKSRRSSEQCLPYLRVANVTRGKLDLDEMKEIGVLEGDEERYRVRQGDVLMIEGNGNPDLLGSAAMWNDELPLVLHQNHLIRVRPESSTVLPAWVMSYVNSSQGRSQILSRAKTSSGLHTINSRVVKSMLMPVPPLEEQQEIVGALAACDEKTAALDREIELHEELFQALLEELMTGQRSARSLVGDGQEGAV
jgi:type I restriction enzyme S subunit